MDGLRQIGYTANRPLLGVQRLSHDPITGADVLQAACDLVIHDDGTRLARLRITNRESRRSRHPVSPE